VSELRRRAPVDNALFTVTEAEDLAGDLPRFRRAARGAGARLDWRVTHTHVLHLDTGDAVMVWGELQRWRPSPTAAEIIARRLDAPTDRRGAP